MTAPYTTLAPIYDTVGMSRFGLQTMPHLLDYALAHEWLGRRIFDLGCGTGAVSTWLGEQTYRVTGVERDDTMLATARAQSSAADWEQGDILDYREYAGLAEMVLAFDVVNEMENINELQLLFTTAHGLLGERQWFAFDLHTVQGVTERGNAGDTLIYDENGVRLFSSHQFDYERQIATETYTAFIEGEDGKWQRQDAVRTLRAHSVQMIYGLLSRRVGFSKVTVLDTDFQPIRAGQAYQRLMIVAQR
jgi:SAM-dependent methyltransferase